MMEDEEESIFGEDYFILKNNGDRPKVARDRAQKPSKRDSLWTCTPTINLHDNQPPTFGIKLKRTLCKKQTPKKKRGRQIKAKDSVQLAKAWIDEIPTVVTIINFSSREDLDRQLRTVLGNGSE